MTLVFRCAIALSFTVAAFASWAVAEDVVVVEAPEVTAEPAAAADANLMAEETAPEAPAAPSNQDVWWGNRSIAFGNYIKFEKSDAVRQPCIHGCYEPCGSCPECREMIFDKIFFDLDKSVLRPEGREECDKIVTYMNTLKDVDVIIQGHCCDLATDQYNVGLGQRRADSVKRYLTEHGIDPARMTTRTYGECEPWKGITERALNRRAVVIVVSK